MEMISIGVGLVMSVGFAVMSWYNLQVERKRSIAREQQLLAAIFSENVQDYLNSVADLESTTKDKVKLNKSEHDLALEYSKADKVQRGIPIT
jgi:hypothetical protein